MGLFLKIGMRHIKTSSEVLNVQYNELISSMNDGLNIFHELITIFSSVNCPLKYNPNKRKIKKEGVNETIFLKFKKDCCSSFKK
ncbi:hypothetical protein PG614_08680 [Riemerella anatipestifer]|nr:hypothetical protein [Riemerella anatipestifer]